VVSSLKHWSIHHQVIKKLSAQNAKVATLRNKCLYLLLQEIMDQMLLLQVLAIPEADTLLEANFLNRQFAGN
jgi:hypothetical protein